MHALGLSNYIDDTSQLHGDRRWLTRSVTRCYEKPVRLCGEETNKQVCVQVRCVQKFHRTLSNDAGVAKPAPVRGDSASGGSDLVVPCSVVHHVGAANDLAVVGADWLAALVHVQPVDGRLVTQVASPLAHTLSAIETAAHINIILNT